MKKVWSILAVLSMSLTALQAVETSVKQLSVDDFYKMKVYNNFDVSYRQSADSAGVIVIMASTEDISHVECVSKKGQLTIKYKGPSDKEQMQGAIIVYIGSGVSGQSAGERFYFGSSNRLWHCESICIDRQRKNFADG